MAPDSAWLLRAYGRRSCRTLELSPNARISIKDVHCVDSERKLMRTIRVKPVSGKTLNGSRALASFAGSFRGWICGDL